MKYKTESSEKLITMLRREIFERNINARKAAEQMRLSQATLSHIMNYTAPIGFEAAIKIARYLKMSETQVLKMVGLEEDIDTFANTNQYIQDIKDPHLDQIAKEINYLSLEQKNAVVNIVKAFKENAQTYAGKKVKE